MTTPELDSTAVACSDCHAPAGAPCIGDTHAVRVDTAQIRATLVEGICTYPHPGGPCGRRLVTYVLHGTLTAVHPDPVDAAACPPLADPLLDQPTWAMQVNLGMEPGRPGPEHFQSLAEQGRLLASERDDLIAAGADPADLAVPIYRGEQP